MPSPPVCRTQAERLENHKGEAVSEKLSLRCGQLKPKLLHDHILDRGRSCAWDCCRRAFRRRWQYWASSRRAEGSSSVRPLIGGKASVGRSVQDAGTAL